MSSISFQFSASVKHSKEPGLTAEPRLLAALRLYLSDLTVAGYDVFIRAQLVKTHGASRVQLLCGDSHFTAQPKFTAVGEACGDIDVYRSTVYLFDEALRAGGVLRDYRIAVVRGVLPNMGNCGIKTVDNCDCENIVEKFGIEVGGGGRRAVDYSRGSGVKTQLNRDQTGGAAVVHKSSFQHGKELYLSLSVAFNYIALCHALLEIAT